MSKYPHTYHRDAIHHLGAAFSACLAKMRLGALGKDDERTARFAGRHEIFFNNFPLSPKGGKFQSGQLADLAPVENSGRGGWPVKRAGAGALSREHASRFQSPPSVYGAGSNCRRYRASELNQRRRKDDSVVAGLEQINRPLEGVVSRMSARRNPTKSDAPSRSCAVAYGSRT
jgi:hypothetical protein